jgi:Protein of unknown function (DUF2281)
MPNTINIEQDILQNLRQLTPEKQQEVLNFTEFLRQKTASINSVSKLSLKEIAAMSVSQRQQVLTQYIPDLTQDFLTNPELTEFSVLDLEGLENDDD